MKIAIMQPYLYPYAGYFRLFAAADLFVILDCVQWNRRGRVHRYEKNGKWETLPIKKTPRDTTRIIDLQWQEGRERALNPVDFIIETMKEVCARLVLPFNVRRASALGIPANAHGQDRIIAICRECEADTYINSPGGRALYDEAEFARHGIKLTFLPEWKGSNKSILERLAYEKPEDVRKEIYANL